MNKVLSQDEVDALLKGMSGGEVATEPASRPGTPDVVPYDFTDRSTYLRGRPLNLHMVNDRFARLFRISLSASVRRPVFVEARPLELKRFGEFIRALPVPTSLHLISMQPLPGLAVMVLESPLIFSLVEAYFGAAGLGRAKVEGREFTAIENRVIHKVVGLALADQEKAWESIESLRLNLEYSETNPQYAEVVAPDEVIISVTFEVELEGPIGLITLCIPYSNMDPIRERLEAPYHRKEQQPEPKWTEAIRASLPRSTVELEVELGRTQITARELLGLGVGDIIVLDQHFNEPLMAKVAGVPKFDGFVGVVKGNKAFKLNGPLEERVRCSNP
jgi:flagellar motor switch protein FliM